MNECVTYVLRSFGEYYMSETTDSLVPLGFVASSYVSPSIAKLWEMGREKRTAKFSRINSNCFSQYCTFGTIITTENNQ